METLARYYSETAQSLVTPLVGDSSITLVENGPRFFGALLAESCYQNSWTPHLYLEGVIWFRASRHGFAYSRIGTVSLSMDDSVSVIQHVATGKLLPNLSAMPHRTIFFTTYEHHRLERVLDLNRGSFFFSSMQRHFGNLPGFACRDNALTSPAGYAEIPPEEDRAMALKVA